MCVLHSVNIEALETPPNTNTNGRTVKSEPNITSNLIKSTVLVAHNSAYIN